MAEFERMEISGPLTGAAGSFAAVVSLDLVVLRVGDRVCVAPWWVPVGRVDELVAALEAVRRG